MSLVVVGTPIGNLGDLPPRAVDVLAKYGQRSEFAAAPQ